MWLMFHQPSDYYPVRDELSQYNAHAYNHSVTGGVEAKSSLCQIPDQAISDNGPQFACEEFREFAREYDFEHITASPHNTQGNGYAERGVQIAKTILKEKDPLLTLMCYHSTPCTSTGASPGELLAPVETDQTIKKNSLDSVQFVKKMEECETEM